MTRGYLFAIFHLHMSKKRLTAHLENSTRGFNLIYNDQRALIYNDQRARKTRKSSCFEICIAHVEHKSRCAQEMSDHRPLVVI